MGCAMTELKYVFVVLMLMLVLSPARAQQAPPATAPNAIPAAPAASANTNTKPPTVRPPIQRRSVQQMIEPTPRIATDAARAPDASAISAPPAPVAPPPRIHQCDAGGCTDTSGARYNGGVGNTLIGPQGQLCTKGVVNAQCF